MKIFRGKKDSRPSSILSIKETDAIRIIRFQGPVDMMTVAEIEKFQKEREGRKGFRFKNLLLDFEKVTHTDSSTVAALVEAASALKKRHHGLGVINLGEELLGLFEIFKVSRLVFIYSSEAEAIKKLTG